MKGVSDHSINLGPEYIERIREFTIVDKFDFQRKPTRSTNLIYNWIEKNSGITFVSGFYKEEIYNYCKFFIYNNNLNGEESLINKEEFIISNKWKSLMDSF